MMYSMYKYVYVYVYVYVYCIFWYVCKKKAQARFECFDANLVTGFAKAPGLGASQALRFDVPWRGNAMGCPW